MQAIRVERTEGGASSASDVCMDDWNVVATIRGDGFRQAVRTLQPFGRVKRTRFYNVLVADVGDPDAMLDEIGTSPSLASVIPVRRTFEFETKDELEANAKPILEALAPELDGRAFHVRVHHRGVSGMSSRDEERVLDIHLLEVLEHRGGPGRIRFDDPDAIIAVEILGHRCGISLWTRDDLRRHPILHLD